MSTLVPGISADEPRVIALQLNNVTVLQALDILLKGTGRNYRLMPGARADGVVTVNFRDVPLDGAVKIVLRSAGLQAARENHTYIIEPILVPMTRPPVVSQQMPTMFPGPPIGSVDVKPSGARTGGQRFDMLLDKANVLEAMRQILEVAGQNYVIDTGLDCAWAGPLGPRISARMSGMTLDDALQALGKSASLVLVKVGSAYTIRPPDGAIPLSYTIGNKVGKNDQGATSTVVLPLCAQCNRPLDPAWLFCPSCGAQVPAPAPTGK
jgi:hypothetical protein